MRARAEETTSEDAVKNYKRLLAQLVDQRPSGTRQRLASALNKNRSFVTQITNPAYPTPIPANHIEAIFDVCHFSSSERQSFMAAYSAAHPKRLALVHDRHKLKAQTFYLPDMGDTAKNERLHVLVTDFVRQIVRLMDHEHKEEKRKRK